jgi:hypothetical protein
MNNPLSTVEYFIYIKQFEKAKIVLDLLRPFATKIGELDQLGKLYAEIREFNDTLRLGWQIYNLVTDSQSKYNSRTNIIRAYLNLNRPVEALEQVLINEAEETEDHANMMDKAMCYFLLDKKILGEEILRYVLEQPHSLDIDNRVKFNLGTYDLRNGNFKDGLKQVLLGGRKLNIWHEFKYPKNQLWEGNPIAGKTIVLCAEGGIGDEIISVRFMQHFKILGMKPVWYTDRKDISAIFERNGFDCVTEFKVLPQDWLWTYSMPTPVYLELEESQLWNGPYIKPLPISDILPGSKKIGIKHSGNPKYDQDLHRTIPIEQLLNSIPEGYTIYSFHVDEDINHPRVTNLREKLTSWDNTLSYLDQMDTVISSCTSLIHAAGAMAKTSIVIVPILTYYTWAYPSKASSWYGDNLTVLRQTAYDNWDEPLEQLSHLL